MLLKLFVEKFIRKLIPDVYPSKKRYMVECFLYNLYTGLWLVFTIYVWISWNKQAITFKAIAIMIDIFAIPVGITDTWSYKKWLAAEEKLKRKGVKT